MNNQDLRRFISAVIVIASFDTDEESMATIEVSNEAFRIAEANGIDVREFETMKANQHELLQLLFQKVVRS